LKGASQIVLAKLNGEVFAIPGFESRDPGRFRQSRRNKTWIRRGNGQNSTARYISGKRSCPPGT